MTVPTIARRLEEGATRARAISASPARLPSASPPPIGDPPPGAPRRQMSFRLGEHERLLEAARLFGMRLAVLARVLTVRGVDCALRDARRGEG